jgi:predicted nucleic acid-binding protein
VTPLGVDASTVIKWLLPEVHSAVARCVPREDNNLLAPDLQWAELGNVLRKRCRAGEIGAEDARDLLLDFRRLPIGIIPSMPSGRRRPGPRHAVQPNRL